MDDKSSYKSKTYGENADYDLKDRLEQLAKQKVQPSSSKKESSSDVSNRTRLTYSESELN